MLQSAETAPNVQKPAGPSPRDYASGLGLAMEQATLGASVVVKGEITGSQALYVDGRVEGSIHFPDHRVTIGRGAVIKANIQAKELVVMGAVTGDVDCSDRVDIRCEAVLTGDVLTQRISIDEGAMVRGKVEVQKMHKRDDSEMKVQADPEAVAQSSAPIPPEKEEARDDAGMEAPRIPKPVRRVGGSKVLFEEKKDSSGWFGR